MLSRQSGQIVLLSVSTGTVAPDEAPEASVYDADGDLAAGPFSLPPYEGTGATTFAHSWRCSLSSGRYAVVYSWRVSGDARTTTPELLRVLPGGSALGAYRNLTFFEPPHARYVVGQRDSDRDEFRRNPRVR